MCAPLPMRRDERMNWEGESSPSLEDVLHEPLPTKPSPSEVRRYGWDLSSQEKTSTLTRCQEWMSTPPKSSSLEDILSFCLYRVPFIPSMAVDVLKEVLDQPCCSCCPPPPRAIMCSGGADVLCEVVLTSPYIHSRHAALDFIAQCLPSREPRNELTTKCIIASHQHVIQFVLGVLDRPLPPPYPVGSTGREAALVLSSICRVLSLTSYAHDSTAEAALCNALSALTKRGLVDVMVGAIERIMGETRDHILSLNEPKKLKKAYKADIVTKQQAEKAWVDRQDTAVFLLDALAALACPGPGQAATALKAVIPRLHRIAEKLIVHPSTSCPLSQSTKIIRCEPTSTDAKPSLPHICLCASDSMIVVCQNLRINPFPSEQAFIDECYNRACRVKVAANELFAAADTDVCGYAGAVALYRKCLLMLDIDQLHSRPARVSDNLSQQRALAVTLLSNRCESYLRASQWSSDALPAAKLDVETALSLDPTHAKSRSRLQRVCELLEQAGCSGSGSKPAKNDVTANPSAGGTANGHGTANESTCAAANSHASAASSRAGTASAPTQSQATTSSSSSTRKGSRVNGCSAGAQTSTRVGAEYMGKGPTGQTGGVTGYDGSRGPPAPRGQQTPSRAPVPPCPPHVADAKGTRDCKPKRAQKSCNDDQHDSGDTDEDHEREEGVDYRQRPKYVDVHPNDDLDKLPSELWQNPRTFKPKRDRCTGFVEGWGMEHCTGDAFTAKLFKATQEAPLYAPGEWPELQFIKNLATAKAERIRKRRLDMSRESLFSSGLVLRIELMYLQRPVWREFRVSGGMTLCTLQDRILQPAMGWRRNYHSYVFTDVTDGAIYGPPDTGFIDHMHKNLGGLHWLDDRGYCLADLVSRPGDTLLYEYDLRNRWRHLITVKRIEPGQESFSFIGGALACPPEDAMGLYGRHEGSGVSGDSNRAYDHLFTKIAQTVDKNFARQECEETFLALRDAAKAPNVDPKNLTKNLFSPLHFCPRDATQNVHRALATPPPSLSIAFFAAYGAPPSTERIDSRSNPDTATLDRIAAACGGCGATTALSVCKGCNKMKFCGRECLKAAWPFHKVHCKRKASSPSSS